MAWLMSLWFVFMGAAVTTQGFPDGDVAQCAVGFSAVQKVSRVVGKELTDVSSKEIVGGLQGEIVETQENLVIDNTDVEELDGESNEEETQEGPASDRALLSMRKHDERGTSCASLLDVASCYEEKGCFWHVDQCMVDTPVWGGDCALNKEGKADRFYKGCQTRTRLGETCQRWGAITPHVPNENIQKVWDGWRKHRRRYPNGFNKNANAPEHGNVCRVADDTEVSPWCYTTNPGVRWDYCDPLQKHGDKCTDDYECHNLRCVSGLCSDDPAWVRLGNHPNSEYKGRGQLNTIHPMTIEHLQASRLSIADAKSACATAEKCNVFCHNPDDVTVFWATQPPQTETKDNGVIGRGWKCFRAASCNDEPEALNLTSCASLARPEGSAGSSSTRRRRSYCSGSVTDEIRGPKTIETRTHCKGMCERCGLEAGEADPFAKQRNYRR